MKRIALFACAACMLALGVASTASAVESRDMGGEKVITQHGHHGGGWGRRGGGWRHGGGWRGGYGGGCW